LLDEVGEAGEVGGGFHLAFLVVFGGEAEFGGKPEPTSTASMPPPTSWRNSRRWDCDTGHLPWIW
jgi:hypothetical protein